MPDKNSDIENTNNLAYYVLQNGWVSYLFPPLLYIICWKLQAIATLWVGMSVSGGYFIVQLTQGARFVSIFLFGLRGALGLILGISLYFYTFEDLHYSPHFWQLEAQNLLYSLVIYFSIDLVKRLRKLNDGFDGMRQSDVIWMVILSSAVCAFLKTQIVPYDGDLEQLPLLSYQVAGRVIGSLVILYLCMFSLSVQQKVRIMHLGKAPKD